MEIFGGPSLLSDQLRNSVATLSGGLKALTAPGGQVAPNDVFALVVSEQLTVNNLQLMTEGFSAQLNGVTLQDGPDAGLRALQLTILLEPSTSMLSMTALAVLVRRKTRAL